MSDDGLGLRQGTLDLRPHDPRWATAFVVIRCALMPFLPPDAALHHIGSTAVPGLPAKPILDLALGAEAADHAGIAASLVAHGWIDRGPRDGHLFIRLRDAELRTHNLHLHAQDAAALKAKLRFRDRLRADTTLRDAYAAKKRAIIDGGIARRDYAEAKTGFVTAALA